MTDKFNDQDRGTKECAGVPTEKAMRDQLVSLARRRVDELELLPPLTIDELCGHAAGICAEAGVDDRYVDFVALMVSNELWRDTVAEVPYERRIFLLPQCLRDSKNCPAQMDEMGLLCEQCGRCVIGMLHQKAEKLGYVVLVAEGTTVVTQLLEQGKVDAVVGVSCLSVLEKAFPYMAANAVPGLAIPLLADGCVDTQVDVEQLSEILEMQKPSGWINKLEMESAFSAVQQWFTVEAIESSLGVASSNAEELAQGWLAIAGKRWRPFLTACAFQAISANDPESVRKVGVAVECFHKASLIHDDIEDGDAERYGRKTLHHEYGTPVALNAGDLLLGEGYRLIAQSGFAPEIIHQLLLTASAAHRALCRGQGEELIWARTPSCISVEQVLDIFRLKTGPAFEVALCMGSICAGAGESELRALGDFSNSLGICYQILDDLDDLDKERFYPLAPSIMLAAACEKEPASCARLLAQTSADSGEWRALFDKAGARERARQLLHFHRHEAVRSLERLSCSPLKNLLRRTLVWILGE